MGGVCINCTRERRKGRRGTLPKGSGFPGPRLTSVALTLSADSEVPEVEVPEVSDAGIVQVLEFLAQVFLALLLIR